MDSGSGDYGFNYSIAWYQQYHIRYCNLEMLKKTLMKYLLIMFCVSAILSCTKNINPIHKENIYNDWVNASNHRCDTFTITSTIPNDG